MNCQNRPERNQCEPQRCPNPSPAPGCGDGCLTAFLIALAFFFLIVLLSSAVGL